MEDSFRAYGLKREMKKIEEKEIQPVFEAQGLGLTRFSFVLSWSPYFSLSFK